MKNYNLLWILCIALFASFTACTDESVDPNKPNLPPYTPEDPKLEEGFNYNPTTPDADQPLTITFKAPASSALYGYAGDVYLHTGVLSEGTWMYVPADWNVNIEKCKMTKVEDNTWSITLSPSIREWYGSGTTAIEQIGVIVRSEDGTKKGVDEDVFAKITDNKFDSFVPGEIKRATMPAGLDYGINAVDNSTVTLVLYDSDKASKHKDYAYVVGDFNDWTLSNDEKSQMNRDDNAKCWWITLSELDPNKEYAFQYYLGTAEDGSMRLADPYCEKVLDPSNDNYIPASTYSDPKEYPTKGIGIVSVFKIQKDNYSWKVNNFKIEDKNNLMIYELLLRDFTESGDLNGALNKLNYLKELGINAIELMPVQEFDGNDSWGYNPCFFFAMDKAYGTKRMYKEFIDACHQKGIAVILDVVYNHATGSHPFAKLYWDSSQNKTSADNPWFNVDAPHPFSVFHDFNHEERMVQDYFKRNLKFLLEEYKVDGFRFDLAKGFTQTSSDDKTAGNYDQSRIDILTGYHTAVTEVNPDAVVILELFSNEDEEKALSDNGLLMWRNMNNAYKQTAMGWQEDSDFNGLTTWTTSLKEGAWVGYMESHDEERCAYAQTQWGNGNLKTDLNTRMKQLETNAAFFFTVCGPKMIWQFGELGYDFSLNSNKEGIVIDEEDHKTDRKPIRWNFVENDARKGVYTTYSQLMSLRNKYPQLFNQPAFMDWRVSISDWNEGRYLRLESATQKLVVVGNFKNKQISTNVFFGNTGNWYELNGGTINVTDSEAQPIIVPANSFRLFTTFQVSK